MSIRFRDGKKRERFGGVYLTPSVFERLRIHCALNRRPHSEAIEEALLMWLPTVERSSQEIEIEVEVKEG